MKKTNNKQGENGWREREEAKNTSAATTTCFLDSNNATNKKTTWINTLVKKNPTTKHQMGNRPREKKTTAIERGNDGMLMTVPLAHLNSRIFLIGSFLKNSYSLHVIVGYRVFL